MGTTTPSYQTNVLAYADLGVSVIDADAHVTEPPDLWSKRVPKNLLDRAPQPVKLPNGSDGWSFQSGSRVMPLNPATNSGGLAPHQVRDDNVVTYDTIRPSHFDGKARLEDMDIDGLGAAVIYSTVGLGGAAAFTTERDVQVACVRAYNDWLIEEFCAADPKRLHGVALAPTTGVDDLLAECEHAMKTGHKGIILTRWPNGGQRPIPEDDKFWKFAEESNLPVCVHFGPDFGPTVLQAEPYGAQQVSLGTVNKAGASGMIVLDSFMGQALAERYPKLKIGLIESNIGWIPCYLEQADDRWMHYRWWTHKAHLKIAPSQQWHRNYHASFMCDRIGVELRHHLGVNRIMYSTDFPHGGHEWPSTRNQIDRLFRGVPLEEKQMILHDNACSFYGLDA